MKYSDSIDKIAPALVAAQAAMQSLAKDSNNSFFNSKYTSLDAFVAYVRPILAKHDLALIQGTTAPHTDERGALKTVTLETMLLHSSGEFIVNAVVMPVGTTYNKSGADTGPSAQTAGSSVTYGRRYGLGALLSLTTDDDDDGNAGSQKPAAKKAPDVKPVAPVPASDFHNFLMPMGRSKGKRLADVETKDLESAAAWATEKGKFLEFVSAAESELESRGVPSRDLAPFDP